MSHGGALPWQQTDKPRQGSKLKGQKTEECEERRTTIPQNGERVKKKDKLICSSQRLLQLPPDTGGKERGKTERELGTWRSCSCLVSIAMRMQYKDAEKRD